MRLADLFGRIKVGNGSGDFQHACACARREREFPGGVLKQIAAGLLWMAVNAQLGVLQFGIAFRASLHLYFSGFQDTRPYLGA